MSYAVEIKELAPVRVAYMTHRGVTEANAFYPAVFGAINGRINNTPFFLYHEMNTNTIQGVVDVCEPTAEQPNNPEVKIKEVPSTKALVARHTGPYDTIYMAYKAMTTLTGSNREMFVKGPNLESDPANFVTDVVVPLAVE